MPALFSTRRRPNSAKPAMNQIIYIVGAIVIVALLL